MRYFINAVGYPFAISALLFSAITNAAHHQELSFGGFASQGLVYTSGNTFFDEEHNVSAKMTEVAIQANYLFTDKLRFSGQAIYRNWGKRESLLVDYLMADYQIALSESNNIGFRVGRIKSDLGLVNVTRDIPNARPSIFLPQSVYQDLLRDTTTSYDGFSIYGNTSVFDSRVSWSFAYGRYPTSSNLNDNILDKHFEATLTPEPNIQLMATWESPLRDWIVSFGYEDPKTILNGNESAPIFTISDGFIEYKRYLLSTQYFSENWDFTLEYIIQNNDINGFDVKYNGVSVGQSEQVEYTSDGYYGQFTYIINEDITALARYERFASDYEDREGELYLSLTGEPDFSRYHDDLTFGLKWQLSPRWLVHAEAHFIEGVSTISPVINTDRSVNGDKYWQLYTAQISYSF